ncbi:MAG: hypothetical protein AB1916_06320 [Thermodesulfobacteriota bacterium]
MPASFHHMPAAACAFHVQDRCLYPERLNPGLDQSWRCVVWREWEADFDAFLHRAEAFSLDDDAASRLWAKRQARLLAAARTCPDFTPGGEGPVGCVRDLELLCLGKLPACAGRCVNYRPGRASEENAHEP